MSLGLSILPEKSPFWTLMVRVVGALAGAALAVLAKAMAAIAAMATRRISFFISGGSWVLCFGGKVVGGD